METQAAVSGRPRLNPFLFPSDVDLWLALLVASLLGASLYLYSWLYTATRSQAALFAYGMCPGTPLVSQNPDVITDWATALERCQAPFEHAQAAWMAIGVGGLVVVSVLIFGFIPAWKIYRSGLVPLRPDDDPQLVASLTQMSQEAGLRRPPVFLWNPLNAVATGVAFGSLGRHYVALTGGLVRQYRRQPDVFRAVLLHELAHLRNGDVEKAYFAVAVWWAFLVAALLPFAVSLALQFRSGWGQLWSIGWRTAGLVALVYLTRNAVLRARESYADVRASLWDGPAGALRRVLERMPRPHGNLWRRTFAVHPDPAIRRQIVDDTDPLLRVGFWEALGTGIAFTIAFPNLSKLLTAAFTARLPLRGLLAVVPASLLAGVVLAPLAVGVIGVGLWRTMFGALMRGEAEPRVRGLALGLGLGTVVGLALSYEQQLSLLQAPAALVVAYAVVWFLWTLVLSAVVLIMLRWIVAGAAVWLRVRGPGRPVRAAYLAGLSGAAAILAGAFGLLFFFHYITQFALGSEGLAGLPALAILSTIGPYLILTNPLTLVVLVALWAFPLSAALVRQGRGSSDRSQAFLDGPPGTPLPATSIVSSPGRALRIGGGVGAVFCLGVFLIRLTGGPGDDARAYLELIAAVILQAIVAVFVARRLGDLRLPHGMLAAFACGAVIAIGIQGIHLLFTGSLSLSATIPTFSLIVNAGGVLALPLAFAASRPARGRARPGLQPGGTAAPPPAPVSSGLSSR